MQNGDINHRIQVIEQNGKDIPLISIDSLGLRRLLPILNRYIEIFDISKISILKRTIRYDAIYRNDNLIFSIYRPISNLNLHLILIEVNQAAFLTIWVFTARRYPSAVLAVIVCLSVRLSVCLSQVGVVQRWRNLGSD